VLMQDLEIIKPNPQGELAIEKDKLNYANFLTSLIYPFIDTYWVTLTFVLKFMLG